MSNNYLSVKNLRLSKLIKMPNKRKFKDIKKSLLGNAEETDIDLEGGMLSCIEEKRGCARCKCTFLIFFSIICVLYYRSIS